MKYENISNKGELISNIQGWSEEECKSFGIKYEDMILYFNSYQGLMEIIQTINNNKDEYLIDIYHNYVNIQGNNEEKVFIYKNENVIEALQNSIIFWYEKVGIL